MNPHEERRYLDIENWIRRADRLAGTHRQPTSSVEYKLESSSSANRASQCSTKDGAAFGPETVPVEDALDQFMADAVIRNLTHKSLRFYRQQLAPFITHCREHHACRVSDIGAPHIRQYMRMRKEDGLSDNSIRAAYRAIRAFLNFCVREGMIHASPMSKVRTPRCEKRILPALSMDDVTRLIAACEHERDRAIVMVLVDTGIRASELIGMRGADVDLDGCRIRVHGKGRKDRYVFFSPHTGHAIAAYYRRRGNPGAGDKIWLSTTRPRPLTQSGLRQLLERLGARTGIENTNPHSFRRTFAVTCLRNGMDIFKLSRLMGHEDIAILRSYLPLVDADSQEAHARYGPLNGLAAD